MATRTTQLGASASRRRATSGTRASSRTRATASGRGKTTPVKSAKTTSRRPAKNSKPSRRSYVMPLVIVAIIVMAGWSFYPVARLQYAEEREQAHLEAELDGLKERNAELREQVDNLKTPEGVEQIARESLGMVKEGENLVVIVDGTETPVDAVAEPSTDCIPEPEPSLWQSVLDTVFGIE